MPLEYYLQEHGTFNQLKSVSLLDENNLLMDLLIHYRSLILSMVGTTNPSLPIPSIDRSFLSFFFVLQLDIYL